MARSFNGTSDLIDLGNPTALNPSFPMTVCGWVNPTSAAAYRAIISRGSSASTARGWSAQLRITDGLFTFTKFGVVSVIATTLSAGTNTWTFYAAVVSSTKVHFVKITTGGTVTTEDVSDSNAFGVGTLDSAAIGVNKRVSYSEWFPGSIEGVAVWVGTALTDTQLANWARFSKPGLTPSGIWPIFGLQTTEPDLSGNGKNGTCTGTSAASGPSRSPLGQVLAGYST